jgi:ABC-type branched-subunit amino acid transport system substrate-binding protein
MAYHARDRYATAEVLRDELSDYLAQHATVHRARGLGSALSELFGEERARIRQLIDDQLKGARSDTASLPVLHDLRQRSSESMYDGRTGVGSLAQNRSAQITYSGEQNARPPTSMQVRSSRKHLAIASAIVAVAAAGVAVTLTRGPGAPRAVSPAGTPPAASAPAATVAPGTAMRGVTDDSVTVGMSAAFSGGSRELGNRMKLGLETAFAATNEAGGVAGRQIKLLALDDGYEGKRALANVQELVSDRHVFAILGSVGTPTTKEALPYLLANKVLLFGAFTGSGILRRDPPDRYVFNYRASYEEETAKMINYLVDVKKVPDRSIVVFAQNDSYGDAGFEGAAKTLRKKGHSDEVFRVGYERNTLEVDDAVNKIAEYNSAAVRLGNSEIYRPKHPVKAIIMVGTYKASAKFIQKIRDRKIDATFLNVSFVGSGSLAEELKERGPGYGAGVIVTQVVPHYEAGATGIIRYRDALKKYHPDQEPDFISLEGYVVGELFAEALRRQGRELDTEKLIDTLEHLQDFDPGTGNLSFGMSQHQASHKVWGTILDDHGEFRSLDMD